MIILQGPICNWNVIGSIKRNLLHVTKGDTRLVRLFLKTPGIAIDIMVIAESFLLLFDKFLLA